MMLPTTGTERIADEEATFFDKVRLRLREAERSGIAVLDFSVGNPDLPPPAVAGQWLAEALKEPSAFDYPDLYGEAELRAAIAHWMAAKWGVALDPETEVLPLLGAKEGIAHLALSMLEHGDKAAYGVPAYPIYREAIRLARAVPIELVLSEEDGYLPTRRSLMHPSVRDAKLLYLNYPHNPTGAVLTSEAAAAIVDYAEASGATVCMDCVYARISPGSRYQHRSLLAISGAKDRCVEIYSFSKDFNLPGIRLGFAVGSASAIAKLKRVKTNVDVSAFKSIQSTASKLLLADSAGAFDLFFRGNNDRYGSRALRMAGVFAQHGLMSFAGAGGFYLWFQSPPGWSDVEWCEALFEETGMLLVPGTEFGDKSGRWCRMTLSKPDTAIAEAAARLDAVLKQVRRERVFC